MDYYKRKKVDNIILFVIFVIGIVLQIQGHAKEGYSGLFTQLASLVMLLVVLYFYNRRYR